MLRDIKEMPPFCFIPSLLSLSGKNCLFCSRGCDHFWQCGLLCVSPVEWFLLWVSVKLWGVNRLLEEPSHQVEGVRFWSLAVVHVYVISVFSPTSLHSLGPLTPVTLFVSVLGLQTLPFLPFVALKGAFSFYAWRGWALMRKPAMFKYLALFWSSSGSGHKLGGSLLLWPRWLT